MRAAWSGEWLDGAWALLDEAGRVRVADEAMSGWLGARRETLEGADFWEALRERCPFWAGALEPLTAGSAPLERVELPTAVEGGGPAMSYRVELARLGMGGVVRVASSLPCGEELAEAGWHEAYRGAGAGREMFVRLLRAESQVARLARHWPGVIFSQRADFSMESVSGRIGELTGLEAGDWRQQRGRFWDVVHEGDAVELQQRIARAAQRRESVTTTFRVRNVGTGRVSYVLEHRQPVVSGGGLVLGYEGVWLDVTRQTLAEKLLTSAAWKETLGVLTMGLAHDFSNVMAGIHSLSESFLSQIEAGHEFHEGLGLIRKSSLQASQLVHRIVNLHLGKPGERNYHDLNQVVGELMELVRKVIPRRIVIAPELAAAQLPVYVDAFEIRQVIVNLALNAADAMPERGRLVFRTARLVAPPATGRFHGVAPTFPCVCLTVQDTGCGIKPAHLDLLFDPFFTTKSGSKGSGLGLYNARLFAEKHRGGIQVESTVGQGTMFHVCLPEADFSEAERMATPEPRPAARPALLLYGPPSRLFDEVAEVLRTGGYHVATVHSLERATEFLAAGDYTYGALFLLLDSTGVVLGPHVDAWRKVQPGLRVVLRPIGRDRDELDAGLLRLSDLVLTPELSPPVVLEKLGKILGR